MSVQVHHGCCLVEMRKLIDAGVQVDAIVTDPPYLINFMGKSWDAEDGIAGKPEVWRLALQLLRPGGHLVAFSGSRTYHRMVCAIEDAGFEIRDQLMWVYGSGWPKNRAALKPAHEPIVLARKPLAEPTVAAQVLATGTGALNIDACRVAGAKPDTTRGASARGTAMAGGVLQAQGRIVDDGLGRWPANVCHDGSDEVLEAFARFGEKTSGTKQGGQYGRASGVHEGGQRHDGTACYADTGTAARFFYSAKASAKDRAGSKHPTIKPVALMRWLVRLVTPPGGTVLDMFAGSGTTGQAALEEGFSAILIEREAEYLQDIINRIDATRDALAAAKAAHPPQLALAL